MKKMQLDDMELAMVAGGNNDIVRPVHHPIIEFPTCPSGRLPLPITAKPAFVGQ